MTHLPTWVQDRLAGRRIGPGAVRVVETLELKPQMASYASTAEIAERSGVNIATVVRTAQVLGFGGWTELRQEIRSRYLASLSAVQVLNEHAAPGASRARDAVMQDIANLEAFAGAVDQEQIARVAGHIAESGQTLVIGSGSFLAPGLQLAHVGQTMGLDIRPGRGGGTTLFNEVGLLGQQDVVVVFSFWWIAREILEGARAAATNGATIVVVTDRQSTPFTELADETIVVSSEGASTFPSLSAAHSVVHCLLGEIAARNEADVRAAISRAESLWRQNDLFGS